MDHSINYYNRVSDGSEDNDLAVLINAAADADARNSDKINEKVQDEEIESNQKNSIAKDESDLDDKISAANVNRGDGDFKYSAQNVRVGTKRKLEDSNSEENPKKRAHATVVAAHYNTLEEKGQQERIKSRIFHMRNFNNWIKSMLVDEYLTKAKQDLKYNAPVRVMDMCCGKGGDLLKWRQGNISYLICTDIASVSLEQCESRYREMCSRERNPNRVFKAEFISADCTKFRLRQKFRDPSIKLDLVSCQFAFHYSFESLPQAECMVRNAAECLRPGGYFVGTMPDANVILSRQRRAGAATFGNDVYHIHFQCDTELPPLFGAKYDFHLEGVVDCPEFLVHFGTFVKLARKFGLQLVHVATFPDYYESKKVDGYTLLAKMQCLETYPPAPGDQLQGKPDDYKHADEYREKHKSRDDKIGTLSVAEWEAISLYLTFAFKKAKTIWGPNSEPQYEFS